MITDSISSVHVSKGCVVVQFSTHWRAMCIKEKIEDFLKYLSEENARYVLNAITPNVLNES